MAAGMQKRNEPSETIEPEENHTQVELLDELWEQIISKLTLKDNIRTSAVHKRFLSIATSVQKANKPPWLVIPPKSGDLYELYDPCKRKSYSLEFPELRGAQFFHSKDGWLLMFHDETSRFFLFYPYTRELIQLPEIPDLSFPFRAVGFSAAPTSPECMVLLIHIIDLKSVRIFTCRPGETRWTNTAYHDEKEFYYTRWDTLLFCNGLFYYFNIYYNVMGIYNPDESSYSIEDIPVPENKITTFCYYEYVFVAEHDGEIIITYTFTNKSPVVYKLDLPNQTSVEMETLGGRTLFVSALTSHVRTNLLGNARNNVYLPKVQSAGESCISYSFNEGIYFTKKQRHDWKNLDSFESIWIDAPNEDRSTVL